MKDLKNKKDTNLNSYPRIKERAALLANSINELKEQGIVVFPYEPIEGKMFW